MLELDSGQFAVDSGQFNVDSGQWIGKNGLWTFQIWTGDRRQWIVYIKKVDSGQWTMNSGKWTVSREELNGDSVQTVDIDELTVDS